MTRPFLGWRQTAGLLLLVLMTACGGGGGDAPAANPGTSIGQPPPPALSGWKVEVVPGAGQIPIEKGQAVLFKASGTGTVLSVEWDFGDGIKLINTTSQEASHTFLTSGDLTVTVTLVGAAGDRLTASAVVKVLPPPLSLSIDQTSTLNQPLLRGARVRFAANVTPVSGLDQPRAAQAPAGLRYRWTFSDGATSDTPALTHRFDTAGSHDVTLTVTDEHGRDITAKRTLTVNGDVRPTIVQTNLGGPAR